MTFREQDAELELERWLKHFRKGHKNTAPFKTLEEARDTCWLEGDEKEPFSEMLSEAERWHSHHHTEYKDFMRHIMDPYSHV